MELRGVSARSYRDNNQAVRGSVISFDEARLDGAADMKARITEALQAAHARDTAYDECDSGRPCSQCATWYQAMDVVPAV